MKTWSQSCHSFHAVNALESPKLSKRATPKAPRLCTYIESTLDNERQNRSKPIRLYTIHLMRRSRWLVLDNFTRTARFLLRQNQSVQLRLICIYVCPTSAHRGFRYGYRRYKGNTFTLKTALFGWQSMILRSDLTLLNINISKNSM